MSLLFIIASVKSSCSYIISKHGVNNMNFEINEASCFLFLEDIFPLNFLFSIMAIISFITLAFLRNHRYINSLVPNSPFLYPLKHRKTLTVFWCFQGIEKGCIGNEWVKWHFVVSLWGKIYAVSSQSGTLWYAKTFQPIVGPCCRLKPAWSSGCKDSAIFSPERYLVTSGIAWIRYGI